MNAVAAVTAAVAALAPLYRLTAGLCGADGGMAWGVSHYRLKPR